MELARALNPRSWLLGDARGKEALFVGGGGLYYRGVVDGLEFPGTEPAVRALLMTEAAVLGGEHIIRRVDLISRCRVTAFSGAARDLSQGASFRPNALPDEEPRRIGVLHQGVPRSGALRLLVAIQETGEQIACLSRHTSRDDALEWI